MARVIGSGSDLVYTSGMFQRLRWLAVGLSVVALCVGESTNYRVILTYVLGYLVAKTWQHWGRLEQVGKVLVCRLLDHPTSELTIDPGRIYVKCACGFVSPVVSVPRRSA